MRRIQVVSNSPAFLPGSGGDGKHPVGGRIGVPCCLVDRSKSEIGKPRALPNIFGRQNQSRRQWDLVFVSGQDDGYELTSPKFFPIIVNSKLGVLRNRNKSLIPLRIFFEVEPVSRKALSCIRVVGATSLSVTCVCRLAHSLAKVPCSILARLRIEPVFHNLLLYCFLLYLVFVLEMCRSSLCRKILHSYL